MLWLGLASPLLATILVFDASGSMWGQIDGVPKITIARSVVHDLLPTLPPERRLGLVSYGHRRKGDCKDIQHWYRSAPTAARSGKAIDSLNPRGMTPMTAAVQQAAEELKLTGNKAAMILVSDGHREGGAQVLAGAVDESLYPFDEAPRFVVRTYPATLLRAMRAGVATIHPLDPRRGDWEIWTMTDVEQQRVGKLAALGSCPPVVCSPGLLTLEVAKQDRIAGSFQFDVIHWRKDRYADGCDIPLGRDRVVGHFNVSSTDDGNSGAGQGNIVPSSVPGAPIFKLDTD